MAQFVFVAVVDHRRQRGGFAGTGGPGDQHQAARIIGDGLETLGGLEIFQRQYLGRDGAHHRARAAVLHEGIDAKPSKPGNLEGEVDFLVLFIGLALPVVHDVIHQAVHFLVLHRRQVDPADVAMHADHRRQAGGKMQVGSLVLDAEGKQFGDIHYNRPGLVRRLRAERRGAARIGMFCGCVCVRDYDNNRFQLASCAQRDFSGSCRGRADAGEVMLLAVSKTFPPGMLREAYAAGQTRFAESYVQEALEKIAALRDLAIEWHYIGPIQSNKTRAIAENFAWVHSVDRLKIAERLSEQRPAICPRCRYACR